MWSRSYRMEKSTSYRTFKESNCSHYQVYLGQEASSYHSASQVLFEVSVLQHHNLVDPHLALARCGRVLRFLGVCKEKYFIYKHRKVSEIAVPFFFVGSSAPSPFFLPSPVTGSSAGGGAFCLSWTPSIGLWTTGLTSLRTFSKHIYTYMHTWNKTATSQPRTNILLNRSFLQTFKIGQCVQYLYSSNADRAGSKGHFFEFKINVCGQPLDLLIETNFLCNITSAVV